MLFHGLYILATDPLIVSTFSGYPFKTKLAPSGKVLGEFPDNLSFPASFEPKYVLEHVPGWAVPVHRMAKFKARQILHRLERREHSLLVNAPDENRVRQSFLIRGDRFSANLYINEHLYKPLAEPKIYDAIYTAQLAAFKRLSLAKQVTNLMVVSYGGDLHAYCPELHHADFNREFLPRPELARKYNQAYAGLCLSAQEGAMLASCEYLLCGIPVVSTPSKGGRDQFFSPHNSIIVPPDPDRVAQAVEQWKAAPPDPTEIRQEVLGKINALRLAYCTYIAKLIDRGGGGSKQPAALMEQYFNNPEGIATRFVKFADLQHVDLEKFSI
ncbi:glycosyltransferase [Chamaesiphon sp. OTE_8_metabat_110]|uniref:glycosyltransferase n=1 Tax=Chamaesiphon sp. OTE_8_metabat_110 TaxID=2964696 RepID=UPI00286B1FCE|nr:glycosyltransferase [Chamaesiphon sp. OTE_8_metabat_110]